MALALTVRWPWAATPSLDKAHECSIHLPPPTKTPRPTPLLPWPAKAHEHQLVARGGTGNHATSGLKFRLLIPWLKVGLTRALTLALTPPQA